MTECKSKQQGFPDFSKIVPTDKKPEIFRLLFDVNNSFLFNIAFNVYSTWKMLISALKIAAHKVRRFSLSLCGFLFNNGFKSCCKTCKSLYLAGNDDLGSLAVGSLRERLE